MIAVLLATLPMTGISQEETLDPVYVEAYGGTYSLDCSDIDADRLTVLADRLIFSGKDEEVVASGVMGSLSYWGRNPPTGFEIALLGGEGPDGLLFEVYADKLGIYILAEGYPTSFGDGDGASDEEYRFYRCATDD